MDFEDEWFDFDSSIFHGTGELVPCTKNSVSCTNTVFESWMRRANEIFTALENFTNAGDIEGLHAFYERNCTPDVVFIEKFYGANSSIDDGDCTTTQYSGIDKLAAITAGWIGAMPDLIKKFSDVNLENDGLLITATMSVHGTKVSDLKYPTQVDHNLGS